MSNAGDFPRISRLPPYVFNVIGELKAAARKRGEDVIDFSMGNPDQPTPQPIIDALAEAARRPETHRYDESSAGWAPFLQAVSAFCGRRFGCAFRRRGRFGFRRTE